MTECNYREMQLPFKTVPFKEMNRKQAVQYLNWYIEVLDERIAYLANHVRETGGNGKSRTVDGELYTCAYG